MPRCHRLIIAISCLLAPISPSFLRAQYTVVPLDHQVYPLLQKAETLRLFVSYEMRTLPLHRAVVLLLLQEMQAKSDQLSGADRALLTQMLAEFTDPAIGAAAPSGSEIHAYRYEEDRTQIFVDLRGTQEFQFRHGRWSRLPGDEDVSETTASGAVRARFSDHVFIGLQAFNRMRIGQNDTEDIFDPSHGRVQSSVGRSAFSDQATGYLSLRFGHFGALLGRSHSSWGAGIDDRLALSADNEPLDMARFSLDFRKLRFSYLHANLSTTDRPRYLAGHRIDLRLSDNLQIGGYETVVYGGRHAELGYLNPFVPYHIIEHHLGDRDNNMLGFDLSTFPARGLRAYLEIFIDDLTFNKPLGTFWGNKLAYLAGVHWAQPLRMKNLEVSASYTRIDPFVYTHYDSLDIYENFGASIGSRLGPNADRLYLVLALQPLRDTRWELRYSFIRKGTGDVFTAHQEEQGQSKGFLRGTLEWVNVFDLELRHQVKRDIFAGFEIEIRDRQNVNQISGEHKLERYGRFFLDVNY